MPSYVCDICGKKFLDLSGSGEVVCPHCGYLVQAVQKAADEENQAGKIDMVLKGTHKDEADAVSSTGKLDLKKNDAAGQKDEKDVQESARLDLHKSVVTEADNAAINSAAALMNAGKKKLENEYEEEEKAELKKKKRRKKVVVAACSVLAAGAVAAAGLAITNKKRNRSPQQTRYAQAIENCGNGKYDDAIQELEALENEQYADAGYQLERARYLKALEMLKSGRYSEAIELLDTVKTYTDVTEKRNKAVYGKALEMAEQGDRKGAISLMDSLGEWQDAAVQKERITLEEADACIASGRYDDAAALLDALVDREIAAERMNALTYARADTAHEEGRCAEAAELYRGLADYSDAEQKLHRCAGDKLYAEGSLAEAYGEYMAAGEAYFTRAKDYAQKYTEAWMLRDNEKYIDAAEQFIRLGAYADSHSQAEECRILAAREAIAAYDADKAYSYLEGIESAEAVSIRTQIESYRHAGEYAEKGDMLNAANEYTALNGFCDADARADECYAAVCAEADKLRDTGDIAGAYEVYCTLPEGKDGGKAAATDAAYSRAEQLFAAGDYEGARQEYTALGNFKNCTEQLTACCLNIAARYAEAGEWTKAEAEYVKASAYTDVSAYMDELPMNKAEKVRAEGRLTEALEYYLQAERTKENKEKIYTLAQELDAAGNSEAALRAYSAVKGYRNSDDAINAILYANAEKQYSKGQYDEAKAGYIALAGYKDSAERAEDCDAAKAGELIAQGDIEAAEGILLAMSDREKAAEMLNECAYLRAEALFAEGRHAEAKQAYAALGNYKNSAERINACDRALMGAEYDAARELLTNGDTEGARQAFSALQGRMDVSAELTECDYADASALLASGDLAGAKVAFEALGDYKDSAEKAAECGQIMLNEEYAAAKELLENGDIEAARKAFGALQGRMVVSRELAECDYMDASALFASGDHAGAKAAFEALGDYKDSKSMVDACIEEMTGDQYRNAMRLMEKENYFDAEVLLKSISNIRCVDSEIAQCRYLRAEKYFEKGKYSDAEALYAQMEGYENSSERLTECRIKMAEMKADDARQLMEKGNTEEARQLLWSIADRIDISADMAECTYIDAKKCFDDGDIDRAEALAEESGNANALLLITECRKTRARRFAEAGDAEGELNCWLSLCTYTEAENALLARAGEYENDGNTGYAAALLAGMKGSEKAAETLYAMAENEYSNGNADMAFALHSINAEYEPSQQRMLQLVDSTDSVSVYSAAEKIGSDGDRAAKLFSECYTKAAEQRFSDAMQLMDSGKYAEAIAILENVEDIAEAKEKLNECKLMQARQLLSDEKYLQAYKLLKELGDFGDAYEMICRDDRLLYLDNRVLKADLLRNVGDTVLFGRYVYDGIDENDAEPVQWIVMSNDGEKAVLIAKQTVEMLPFDEKGRNDWERSTIREWLNGEFIRSTFNDDEQLLLLADDNEDFVSIPARIEAISWLEGNGMMACVPSGHVMMQYEPFGYVEGISNWWLKDAGYTDKRVVTVNAQGRIYEYGNAADAEWVAVRPVICVKVTQK